MKIAICSTGTTPSSQVSNRFARCESFMIFDQTTKQTTFIDNSARGDASGAGGKAAKNLSDLDVAVVLVPQLGPKAFDALRAFDMEAYEYRTDITVDEALTEYLNNEYSKVQTAKGKGKH